MWQLQILRQRNNASLISIQVNDEDLANTGEALYTSR